MRFPQGIIVYAISNSGIEHRKYFEELVQTEIDIIQLRDKQLSDREFYCIAEELKYLARRKNKIFIINDRVHIAAALNVDGVHLGEKDLPLKDARKLLGKNKIIGYSCHNFRDAKFAQTQSADYISIGPLFKTPTKKGLEPVSRSEIELIKKKIKLPQIAIGGINLRNIFWVKKMNFQAVAMFSALVNTRNKKNFVSEIKRILSDDSNSKTKRR